MTELVWRLVFPERSIQSDEINAETGKPPYIGDPALCGAKEMQVLGRLGVLLARIELPIGARPIAFKRRAAIFGQTGPANDAGTEFFFGYQITEDGRNRKVILSVNPEGVVRVTETDGRN